jgi:hypothetical protein
MIMALRIVGGTDPQRGRDLTAMVTDTLRDRRRRVNDEQALEDMLGRGTSPDVSRETHLRVRRRPPSSGERLLLIGMVIGSLIVIGFLLATWPAVQPVAGCTP